MRPRSPAQISSVPRGRNPRVNTETSNLRKAFDVTHLIPKFAWSKKRNITSDQTDRRVCVRGRIQEQNISGFSPGTCNGKPQAQCGQQQLLTKLPFTAVGDSNFPKSTFDFLKDAHYAFRSPSETQDMEHATLMSRPEQNSDTRSLSATSGETQMTLK